MATKNTAFTNSKSNHKKNASDMPNTDVNLVAQEMNAPESAEQVQEVPVELVQELAYQKYLSRGEGHGSDVQDWLDAEREVMSAHHPKARPN